MGEKDHSSETETKKGNVIESITYINGEKVFECYSEMGSKEEIVERNECVKILLNTSNRTEHIRRVMSTVNDYFTKRINDIENK